MFQSVGQMLHFAIPFHIPTHPSTHPLSKLQDLLSGLETLANILIDNDFCLDAQPLLALWDYVSYRVAR